MDIGLNRKTLGVERHEWAAEMDTTALCTAMYMVLYS
jgi:hypothetical protein